MSPRPSGTAGTPRATSPLLEPMRSVQACVVAVVLGTPVLACGRQLALGEEATTDREPSDPTLTAAPLPSGEASATEGGSVQATPAADAAVPRKPRIVFVSSTVYTADSIEGLAGADFACNALASAAEVPEVRGRRYVAWLSDDIKSAKARLGSADGPWNRVDGARVADDVAHLLGTAPLTNPIVLDEDGDEAAGYAWTGTNRSSTAYGMNCVGWTMSTGSGVVGALVPDATKWTSAKVEDCGGGKKAEDRPRHHLYCFERDP